MAEKTTEAYGAALPDWRGGVVTAAVATMRRSRAATG